MKLNIFKFANLMAFAMIIGFIAPKILLLVIPGIAPLAVILTAGLLGGLLGMFWDDIWNYFTNP